MKDAQTIQIQRWLAQGHSLTALEALKRFNCMRLGARCFDLKSKGWPVKSEMVKVGEKRVAIYRFGK